MHKLADSTVFIDWHAAVDKSEVLEMYAGYNPSLLAVIK